MPSRRTDRIGSCNIAKGVLTLCDGVVPDRIFDAAEYIEQRLATPVQDASGQCVGWIINTGRPGQYDVFVTSEDEKVVSVEIRVPAQ